MHFRLLTKSEQKDPKTRFYLLDGDDESLREQIRETAGTRLVLCALDKKRAVALAVLDKTCTGSRKQYLTLHTFLVTETYRGRGVGKSLFREVCNLAGGMGARKLRLTAQAMQGTEGFFLQRGVVTAQEPTEDGTEAYEYDFAEKPQHLPVFMCLGLCVGMLFGVAFSQLAIGMALGMLIGTATGLILDANGRAKDAPADAKTPKESDSPTQPSAPEQKSPAALQADTPTATSAGAVRKNRYDLAESSRAAEPNGEPPMPLFDEADAPIYEQRAEQKKE